VGSDGHAQGKLRPVCTKEEGHLLILVRNLSREKIPKKISEKNFRNVQKKSEKDLNRKKSGHFCAN
jgi:hypothetical protein